MHITHVPRLGSVQPMLHGVQAAENSEVSKVEPLLSLIRPSNSFPLQGVRGHKPARFNAATEAETVELDVRQDRLVEFSCLGRNQ